MNELINSLNGLTFDDSIIIANAFVFANDCSDCELDEENANRANINCDCSDCDCSDCSW